jgi:hypothetical protein
MFLMVRVHLAYKKQKVTRLCMLQCFDRHFCDQCTPFSHKQPISYMLSKTSGNLLRFVNSPSRRTLLSEVCSGGAYHDNGFGKLWQ